MQHSPKQVTGCEFEFGGILLLLGLVSIFQWNAKMNISFTSQLAMEAPAVQTRTRARARACAGADTHGKQRNVTR